MLELEPTHASLRTAVSIRGGSRPATARSVWRHARSIPYQSPYGSPSHRRHRCRGPPPSAAFLAIGVQLRPPWLVPLRSTWWLGPRPHDRQLSDGRRARARALMHSRSWTRCHRWLVRAHTYTYTWRGDEVSEARAEGGRERSESHVPLYLRGRCAPRDVYGRRGASRTAGRAGRPCIGTNLPCAPSSPSPCGSWTTSQQPTRT